MISITHSDLLKAGWHLNDVFELVVRVAKAAGDVDIEDRKLAVQTTAEKLEKGEPVTGISMLENLLCKEDAQAISKWVCARESRL